jgi:hypothetical protein
MLTDTQTLSKDSATDVDTNTTVYVRRYADADKSAFSVSGLTLPNEKKLGVSHETTKDAVQRHLVRIDHTVVDAFGVPATASCYMVWVRPANTGVTNAVMLEMTNQLIDLCIEGGSNANVTAILNSEL